MDSGPSHCIAVPRRSLSRALASELARLSDGLVYCPVTHIMPRGTYLVSREPFPITPSHHCPQRSLMSHTHSTSISSPNFQSIFNTALKAYEKHTRSDLLSHPLAAQLQACDSPGAILAVIHQQVQGLHQSQRTDERLTRWLNPTVNVLFALSATLGEGVGLVSVWTRILRDLLSCSFSRYSRLQKLSLPVLVSFF